MRLIAPIALFLAATPALAQAPAYTTAAPIAFLKDLQTGRILLAKDADKRIPPASMGKMMSVYVAFKLIKSGEANLEQPILVREETWKKWNNQGSTMFLDVNSQVSVENLLHGIVTLSGNDACVVLAEGLGGTEANYVALMNREAKRLGLKSSNFANTNGWPDPNEYVTARDLAMIAEATIRDFPDLYARFYQKEGFTWGKTMGAGQAITQGNRNPLLGKVAGADGLKTGHTEEAGYGFTGSAVQNGRRLVMVVAGLPSFGERVSASVDFMNWGFAAWQNIPLGKKGQVMGKIAISGAADPTIDAVAGKDLFVTLPRGFGMERKTSVEALPGLSAPLKAGQQVGNLVVTMPGQQPLKAPLVTPVAIEEAGMFRRAWNWLMSFFG
ncbi:D-alanyl-D-alanine carboxypeptidase family protein [Sandarakinorhabdus limnophila]|uniref:D-alanyl-D-alanine carboxypeptidase family protein n=1 Tax=Sandarakinorhabdus limnophila TaxID=210512 RepID=UPI0026EAC118|nr:D-alanyl-D-alanine carboxypeptidase family protein [Sandarakinorhabdus limnophila]MCM0033249.1 D-alanyl-D-alanine carboxypeptidase [Sandarakinorhabdus limnophila]